MTVEPARSWSSEPSGTSFARLFEPISIGALTLKNRIVLPAHGPRLPAKRYLRYLEERLKNDVALVILSGLNAVPVSSYLLGPPSWIPEGYVGEDLLLPDPLTPEGSKYF